MPFSKTKIPVGLIFLRLSCDYGLNLFLLPNTTHELKAFTIKLDFAQDKKNFLSPSR